MFCSAFCNVLIVLAFFLQLSAAFDNGGYVEVSITKGETLNAESNFADFSNLKVKKINRTHVVDGEIKYTKGLSNEQNCSVSLYKKQGGEYRRTEFKLPSQGCCDFYNSDTFIIPNMQQYCKNCPKQADKVCPWPAGNYLLDKYEYAAEKVPKFLEGDFKAIYQISQGDEILAGYSFYGTIIR